MSFSHNTYPAPNAPILSQRPLQQTSPTEIPSNHESHYFVANGRRFPRDDFSPDDLSLEVLNERSRDIRITLHSSTESMLTPFFQDVPWRTENPRTVHGVYPTIECTGCFQRCFLCIQHSFTQSLPAAVRQKHLRHDHSYVNRQPEEELLLVTQVALDLIEKNYVEAYTKMISNAEERTNPFRMFTRPPGRQRIVLELRARRMNVDDMEKILSSPWAKFDEVEIYSGQSLPVITPDGSSQQPPPKQKPCDDVPRDETFFIVTRPNSENPNSRTNIMIEKYFSNRASGCSDASASSLVETNFSNGQPQPVFCPTAKLVTEARRDRARCARSQNESSLPWMSWDVISHGPQKSSSLNSSSIMDPNVRDRQGLQAMPCISQPLRVLERDLVPRVTRGREIDLEKLDPYQECHDSTGASSQPNSDSFSRKRRSSSDASDREVHNNLRLKRCCVDDVQALTNDGGLTRPGSRSAATLNLFKPRAPCACCAENHPARCTQRSPQSLPVGAPACFDHPAPPIGFKNCCSTLKMDDRQRLEYLPWNQAERYNEVLTSNRISAKCPTCGIIFRTLGVAKSTTCVMSYNSPLGLLRDHMALHRPDILNCVFPSCREMSFGNKDELIAHMDAHRQRLIVAGVERWENLKAGPLLVPWFTKPHLTCEICLIDFNWRTTLPGMLSHTERYIRHCEQHRIKMGEDDYCVWQCVFRGCEIKFTSQPMLEEHMWMVHAVLCHCSTCDWIVWGDTDEVCLHREKCTAQLTDVDFKQSGMKSSTKSASKPSTSGSASNKCLGTASKSSRSVSYASNPLLRRRLKLLRSRAVKSGKPTPTKLDTASSANHLMRFSYYCDYCGAPFRSHHQKQYQSHVQSHLPDKQLTCVYGDCGRKFGSLQELHSHVKTKLSTCRYCGAVLFSNYKKHILTCRPLHEIKKQRLLKEEFAKVKYAPLQPEDLYWFEQKLCRSNPGLEQTSDVPETDGQECFLRSLNLVKGSFETIKAKTRRQEQLRSQIHVANGKGRRACTEKTACVKCGRIFRNALNLREHLRGYHNARDF